MSEPSKTEMLAIICELHSTVQRLYSEYANDVALGRSAAMQSVRDHGSGIAQQCTDRFPYEKIEEAMKRFPQPTIDTRKMRGMRP